MEREMQVQIDPEKKGEDGAQRSIFDNTKLPVSLRFQEVVYKIKIKPKKSQKIKGEALQLERTILHGISGIVLPGEMLAMLGPSGSGKTTLLTAMGGRIQGSQTRLSGRITYNGHPISNSLKRNMGFVTQDDVLYPHLTVTETLVYTALLRLPSTLSRREKAEQAEAVINQLGLAACRNSIIGGGMLRGVSGGERKRVSIGQEMLINPSLLFLDEPTSGLDSTTAVRIVSTLHDLAGGGRTVVMTIHQPSSRLFYMFTKVLLLSDGHPIYFGKASDAMPYFAGVGYTPEVAMNPADFLLDLANGVTSDESETTASVKEGLALAYDQSLRSPVIEEITAGLSKQAAVDECDKKNKSCNQWPISWWEEFVVLLQRGLKERRHESFSGLKIGQIIVSAFLAGFLWFHSSGHIQDQSGLLFFMGSFWGFYPLFQAIFTFPQERMMLTKERSSGMYRLSSYFMARVVGDLPMELGLPVVFISITYWMGHLKRDAASFFMLLSVVLISVLVSQGIGLAIGALVMDLQSATTFASVLMLAFMLAGGFFVQNVPPFIAWIKYISVMFYGFKLELASQFSPDDTYQCAPNLRCSVAEFPSFKAIGFDNKALAVVALFIMLVFYRVLAYLGLMRVGVTR